MIDFVVGELLAEDAQNYEWDGTFDPVAHFRSTLNAAKQAARRGDPGPLSSLLPDLAEFLHEPKRVRGQRRPHRQLIGGNAFSDYGANLVGLSITWDTERVRAIWKREYKRWKRHRDEHPHAEEIVRAYYAVYGG